MKYVLIFIVVFYFPSAFSSVCEESFSADEIDRRNFLRRADEQLKQALKEIRENPEEPVLKAQGYKPIYYKGLDQAREFNEVAKYLRAIKADSEKTHIPYFADQVEKTIADFEKGLRRHNKNKLKFLAERLEILEELKKEAYKRVENQNVTYDWWAIFNLRLTMIASESNDYIEEMLRMRNRNRLSDPAERVEAGIEIAYNKKLIEKIKKVMMSLSPRSFPRGRAELEKLNPEEILFEGKYTSKELERILINSALLIRGGYDHYQQDVLDKVIEESGLYNDPLKTHEGTQELLSDTFGSSDEALLLGEGYFALYIFNKTKGNFPEEIMFFTTDEPGIMAFNKLGDNSHFVGVSGEPLQAGSSTMDAFNFFDHDIVHIYIARTYPQKVFERIDNISNKSDREKAELALFIFRHEDAGDIFFHTREVLKSGTEVNLSSSELRKLTAKTREFMLIENFFEQGSFHELLPESVNVNNREEIEKFLIEVADVFVEILLTHSSQNKRA